MCNCQDTLIPQIGVVTDICTETADVKTFRVEKIGGGKLFEHLPGQCAILSVPGKGEAIFSITSSPTNEKYMEFSIKRCGSITNFLHFDIEPGQQIAVRGPYGNHFPVEDKLKGKDLLFIAGGIGLAPLRSVINYMLDKRGGDAVKILDDDIITVSGEFTGLEKITRALTSTTDELPRIEVKYADLVDE